MINEAKLEQVRQVITGSSQLTEAERSEWLELLPYMNDRQIAELLTVLGQVKPGVGQGQSTGVQPVPTLARTAPAKVPIATTEPSEQIGNGLSEYIQKRGQALAGLVSAPGDGFSQVKPMSKTSIPFVGQASVGKGNVVPAVTDRLKPVGLVQPVAQPTKVPDSVAQQPVSESGVESSEAVIDELKSLEDIERLNIATLRARGTVHIFKELALLCKKYGYFSVIFVLERSALYRTYLLCGSQALAEHKTFEQVQSLLSASGKPYLTKPEFEEVNDLLQRLKTA